MNSIVRGIRFKVTDGEFRGAMRQLQTRGRRAAAFERNAFAKSLLLFGSQAPVHLHQIALRKMSGSRGNGVGEFSIVG